jgi:hypothetical protein
MKKIILFISFALSLIFTINIVVANYYLTQPVGNPDFNIFPKQNTIEAKVTIFPNPLTKENLTIKADKEFFEIEVLNIVGKSVYKKELISGTMKEVIQLKDFDKGLYLVRLKFGNKSIYTEKLIVK